MSNLATQFLFVVVGIFLAATISNSSQAQTSSTKASREAQLVARLQAADEESRLNAATELGNLFRLTPEAMAPATLAALSNALQNDASPVVRALVARAFETTRDARALPALLTALGREREIGVRKAIIYALAHHPSPQATAALLPLLNDKQVEIRGLACYALAETADPAAANALLGVLQKWRNDEEGFARNQAARGLGRMGVTSTAITTQLVTALTSDKAPAVRRAAAHALGQIGQKQDTVVIEALRTATLAADPYLSSEATTALAQINARAR